MESLNHVMEESHTGKVPNTHWSLYRWKNVCCGRLLRLRVTCYSSFTNLIMTNLKSFSSIQGEISMREKQVKIYGGISWRQGSWFAFQSIPFYPWLRAAPGRNNTPLCISRLLMHNWTCSYGRWKYMGRDLQGQRLRVYVDMAMLNYWKMKFFLMERVPKLVSGTLRRILSELFWR